MATREIFVRLKADASQFKKEMEDASSKTRANVDKLSNAAGLMGLAMVAGAGVAVKAFADFDKQMSVVQAATMETAGNMDLLRDAAIEAGAKTSFSATEAAQGIEQLAKAGVSTTDILNGGLNGALDLAAAGGVSVADAAETAASALTQFGLEGQDVTHVADLLAAGANKAQGGVGDLSAALNQSGLVAAQMGLSIEETVGSLTAFASAGLIGSDAGTSFKAMLLRLAAPTKESQALMNDLGIAVYDTSGEFIGMERLAGVLSDKLGGLDQQTRNAALATIFGQDAIRTSAILYEQGAAGIAKWNDEVDQSGFAAEQAAILLDNLAGDIEAFKGSIETAMIGAGEGANGPLRSMTQSATNLVNEFNALPSAVQQSTVAIAGTGGLALLGVAGVGKLITSVNDAKAAIAALGWTAKGTGLMVAGITGGLTAVSLGVLAFANAQAEAKAKAQSLADTLDVQTGALTENSTAWVSSELTKPQSFGIKNTKSMAEAAEELGVSLETVTRAYLGQPDAIAEAKAAAEDYLSQQNLLNDASLSHSSLAQRFIRNLDDQSARLEQAAQITAAKKGVDEAAASAQGDLAGAYATTTETVAEQIDSVYDLLEAQRKAAGIVMTVMEAESAFQAAIDGVTESVKTNGQTLDLNTEAGRANQAALLDVAKAGWDNVEAQIAQDGSGKTARETMLRSRDAFIVSAQAAGMSADEANRLADELGLIPSNVNTLIQANASQAIAAAEAALRAVNAIPTYKHLTIDGSVTSAFQSAAYAAANTNFVQIKRSAGGPVYGPGSSTSDSIPARLSNGEYVVKAAAVQQYGRAFFDSVNAQRFAAGGYAVSARSQTHANPSPSPAPDLAGALREALDGATLTLSGVDYLANSTAARINLRAQRAVAY